MHALIIVLISVVLGVGIGLILTKCPNDKDSASAAAASASVPSKDMVEKPVFGEAIDVSTQSGFNEGLKRSGIRIMSRQEALKYAEERTRAILGSPPSSAAPMSTGAKPASTPKKDTKAPSKPRESPPTLEVLPTPKATAAPPPKTPADCAGTKK